MSAAWLCAALVVAGWAGVCLGQARMHRTTFGQDGSVARRRGFTIGGGALLVAGFAVAVAHAGWQFGPVLWGVLLSLGAIAWVLALTLDARRAPWLLVPLLVVAMLSALA